MADDADGGWARSELPDRDPSDGQVVFEGHVEQFDVAGESIVGDEWEERRRDVAAKRLKTDLGVEKLTGDKHSDRE